MAKATSTAIDIEIKQRADRAIAHGALTNSKRPESFVRGVYPTHLVRGQGCMVWDTKGRKYIDFLAGLGSSILGYANEEVTQAVCEQARRGATLSLGTDLEVQAAEKVKECFPWVERVRFLKTGTDACSAAVRIARAHTKRDEIASDGYHGWSDDFVSMTAPALGVPARSWMRKEIEPEFSAGWITEPVGTDASEKHKASLTLMREQCREQGIPVIFDEIITGFRFPRFGVSNFWGVEPDLICLGKAIANGMPLSVVAGKKALMECDEYFVSSTFAGETLSLAAALKTMTLLQTRYSLEQLWLKGDQFLRGFNSIWPEGLTIQGYPTRGTLTGALETRALFCQEAVKAGLLFHPSTFFFNFSHVDVMDQVLNVCGDIMLRLKTGQVRLEGELPKSPFAQRVREGNGRA